MRKYISSAATCPPTPSSSAMSLTPLSLTSPLSSSSPSSSWKLFMRNGAKGKPLLRLESHIMIGNPKKLSPPYPPPHRLSSLPLRLLSPPPFSLSSTADCFLSSKLSSSFFQIVFFLPNCFLSSKLFSFFQIVFFLSNCFLSSKLFSFFQIVFFLPNCFLSFKLFSFFQIVFFLPNCLLSSECIPFRFLLTCLPGWCAVATNSPGRSSLPRSASRRS